MIRPRPGDDRPVLVEHDAVDRAAAIVGQEHDRITVVVFNERADRMPQDDASSSSFRNSNGREHAVP